ncbi:hypothetical protein T4B_7235 [Trichinella pseudospiralis]|uniref:Uncharacterized protein n=1 Tax=Trichinella pseudospiralis TaxID=6337 RepID=A0A0V1IHY1_TRIPS|nr:hypothetical protein T4A_9774 [Trichinella pseudospiralis]KRZ22335.1 hypothetical protein T4B_7235 [Trichinella pseudospiralis]KRZ28584.1 hypothetical protein T4C_1272 [Trichinella pseudospiralis]
MPPYNQRIESKLSQSEHKLPVNYYREEASDMDTHTGLWTAWQTWCRRRLGRPSLKSRGAVPCDEIGKSVVKRRRLLQLT